MAKEKVKKGTAYIVRETEENPSGDCAAEKCGVAKSLISSGMTAVKYGGKLYHASCAIYEEIQFKVPSVPKTKKVD